MKKVIDTEEFLTSFYEDAFYEKNRSKLLFFTRITFSDKSFQWFRTHGLTEVKRSISNQLEEQYQKFIHYGE